MFGNDSLAKTNYIPKLSFKSWRNKVHIFMGKVTKLYSKRPCILSLEEFVAVFEIYHCLISQLETGVC